MLDVASARNTSKVSDTAVALFLLLLNSIRRIELGESHVVSELKSGFFFIPLPMKRHILRLVVLISIFQVFVQVKVLASHLARVGNNSLIFYHHSEQFSTFMKTRSYFSVLWTLLECSYCFHEIFVVHPFISILKKSLLIELSLLLLQFWYHLRGLWLWKRDQ